MGKLEKLKIYLMYDGTLMDVETYGTSLYEFLPTITEVCYRGNNFAVNEEEYNSINSNFTEVSIKLLLPKNLIEVIKTEF